MTISTRPIDAPFGAEVVGIDLAIGVQRDEAEQIADRLGRHGVLVFREQVPDEAALVRFGERLGVVAANTGPYGKNAGSPVTRITNLDEHGQVPDVELVDAFAANALWHTDGTYAEPWTITSFLQAHLVPEIGGATQYCDTRRAFERLSPDQCELLRELTTQHSLVHSRARSGFDGWSDARKHELPAVERPLVQRHEPSGRDALCLASHICAVSDHSYEDGQQLIHELTEQATVPEEVYTHRWEVGDVVVWDNRCTMHRGLSYDRTRHARDMRTMRLYELRPA